MEDKKTEKIEPNAKRIKLKKPTKSCVNVKPTDAPKAVQEGSLNLVLGRLLLEKKKVDRRTKKSLKLPEKFLKDKKEHWKMTKMRDHLTGTMNKNKINVKPDGGKANVIKIHSRPRVFAESVEVVKDVISEYFYGGLPTTKHMKSPTHKGVRVSKHHSATLPARTAAHARRQISKQVHNKQIKSNARTRTNIINQSLKQKTAQLAQTPL